MLHEQERLVSSRLNGELTSACWGALPHALFSSHLGAQYDCACARCIIQV